MLPLFRGAAATSEVDLPVRRGRWLLRWKRQQQKEAAKPEADEAREDAALAQGQLGGVGLLAGFGQVAQGCVVEVGH